MSFDQLVIKYSIPRQDFFRYLQLRDFVKKDTTFLTIQDISAMKRHLFSQINSSTSSFYKVLKDCGFSNTNSLKRTWERTLDIQITDDQWEEAWKNAGTLSICNRVKAMQLKILHRAHKFKEDCLPVCPKCKTEQGDLIHCFWFCREIQKFWVMVEQELNVILSINIGHGPKHMLLGIYDDIIVDKHKKSLCKFLTFCARKMYSFKLVS